MNDLLSYQKATIIIYDATVYFTNRSAQPSDPAFRKGFPENGGIKERMTKARLSAKKPKESEPG